MVSMVENIFVSSHSHRFVCRQQVPAEHCALAAQKYVAESPGWAAVMFRERCLSFLFSKTVSPCSSFLSTFERIFKRNWRPAPGSCLYQEKKEGAVAVQVQVIRALPPSWTLRREGCCFSCSPLLTPVQKETAGRPSGHHSSDFVFLLMVISETLEEPVCSSD